MAQTAEGRALTEAHRKAQLAVAARAATVAASLWRGLDVADLDRTTPAWLSRNTAAVQSFRDDSVVLASAYVDAYRTAELGSPDGPVVEPKKDVAVTRNALLLAGPVRVKLLVGRGESADVAYAGALRKYTGIVRRQVLSGGRELVAATTGADTRAIGWRRVTDGNPCTFCAMLASRGPVYRSSENAGSIAGSGLRYHGHCGCTAEIIYGKWEPSEAERRYIEEYEKAAQEAGDAGFSRTQDTVLPRMRANGVFRDSPLSRNN